MIIRISKNSNNKYDITTRDGQIIHTNKELNNIIGYLSNRLQTGFQEIRIIT